MFRLGFLVNPMAGIGGATALKGSDGAEIVAAALARGATPRAEERATRALTKLAPLADRFEVLTWAGAMGERAARAAGLEPRVLGSASSEQTSAGDTREAARALVDAGIDLLLFAGGDGTARDLCAVLPARQPALGIPAGVKMHSGVYAVSPEAAAEVVARMVRGELVGVAEAEVRDIDEEAFRAGRVLSRHHGEMLVPAEPRYVQHTKVGGRESEPLVLEEISAWVLELMAEGGTWVIGPGSTTAAVMAAAGLPNTLLGVDVVRDGEVICADAGAADLERLVLDAEPHLLVTVIGGQGHVFGRGNQQLSPAVIRAALPDRLHVIATRSKLAALEGRPLQVDTGDAELDASLCGFLRVITGYDDAVLCPVGPGPAGSVADRD